MNINDFFSRVRLGDGQIGGATLSLQGSTIPRASIQGSIPAARGRGARESDLIGGRETSLRSRGLMLLRRRCPARDENWRCRRRLPI